MQIARFALNTICRIILLYTFMLLSLSGLTVTIHAAPTRTPTPPPDNTALQVRIVHALPDTGNVDLFIDGNRAVRDLTFGSSSGYTKLSAGKHQFQLAPTGQTVAQAIITQNFIVESTTFNTMIAVGTKKDGFSLIAFQDENTLSQPSMAKVRFYHFAPNLGSIKAVTDSQTLVSELNYKNASDYLELRANTYTFTYTFSAATVQATAPLKSTVQLQPGTVNNIFAIGLYRGQPALQFINVPVKATLR